MSDCCGAAARHFDAAMAERDLAHYRDKGPDKRTRRLLRALERAGVAERSVLDIGAGVGIVSLELLKAGATRSMLADASPAYLAAARVEAARMGLAGRVDTMLGDFVETVARIREADIVALDRVVCCYPSWRPLLEAAMSRGRSLLALTYPRTRPDVRLVIGFDNLRRRVKGDPFRAFVHSPTQMEASVRAAGWRLLARSGTFVWRVDLYART